MSVNTEDLVDSIADKVLAKMKGMSVGVPGGTEASPSVNYFGKSSNRFTTRGKNKSRPRSRNFRGDFEINHQIPNIKDVGHVKAPITMSENALQGFARPVAIKVMIPGTSHAQIIND